jgi:acyl carrier protein
VKKGEFLLLLDEIFEEQPGTLTGREELKDLELWDSLTIVVFIALIDEHFDLILSAEKIYNCQTINDLISLAGSHITPDTDN